MYDLLVNEEGPAETKTRKSRPRDSLSLSSSLHGRTTRNIHMDEDDSYSSTVGLLAVASVSPDSLRKRPVVSSHRRALEFIRTDALTNRRHAVPHMQFDLQTERRSLRRVIGDFFSSGKNCSVADWCETVTPIVSWLKSYDFRSNFITDLIAGLTVGIMIIPQSMSYAKLAGLPVEYGLYSAVFPIYAYACFGSSRQLAVGPVAIISLLLSTGLSSLLEDYPNLSPGTPEYQATYNQMAVQISFLVGITYIMLGICRMGFVTKFLSRAVISGFTTGAAVIIGMSQVKYLLGYNVERTDRFHELIFNMLKNIDNFNWRTFLFGSISICFLLFAKTASTKSPRFQQLRAVGPLIASTIAIILTFAFDLENKAIPVVGQIPGGLPPFTISYWTPVKEASKLIPLISSITLVGFMESIAIAKRLASKHNYEIDSSQELIGLGMSNLMGSMFSSYPVTGSFSRSAVNSDSGAQSGMSGIVSATLVSLVLLFLTRLFEKMPLCILASIVISGVMSLVDFEEALHLWTVHRSDFNVWIAACFGTLFIGVELGLAIAVAVSLLVVIYHSAYPHIAVLGRLPGTCAYINIKQYPEADHYNGVVLIRIEGSLYFANIEYVREKIMQYLREGYIESETQSRYLVLDFSPVAHIDTSALYNLEDMYNNLRSRGQRIVITNPNQNVMRMLVICGLADKIGRDNIFASTHDAVTACLHEMDCEVTFGFVSDDIEAADISKNTPFS
ncbi:hypothetical protein FisN_3Lh277 [Fistulifera solaris]|uniref:STAS domain-containing protein n=1 Tax=Fistulifera solaris TaxID=1519565 RepID=A0A1Z5JP79_FISSO|nr:hypothetical protein FisN_3Lh277 [Fistulifera solaris]|eukprot:GAX15830.1 hypothetical protein FisN_3Lh277 [Fistulifera solaris]